jgi:hypothetical protein
MKITSHMKQVEWDVMKTQGSTKGYKWYWDGDGKAYFMNTEYMWLIGEDGEEERLEDLLGEGIDLNGKEE